MLRRLLNVSWAAGVSLLIDDRLRSAVLTPPKRPHGSVLAVPQCRVEGKSKCVMEDWLSTPSTVCKINNRMAKQA